MNGLDFSEYDAGYLEEWLNVAIKRTSQLGHLVNGVQLNSSYVNMST